MEKEKRNVLREHFKLWNLGNLEERLSPIKETLSFLGFDTVNEFKVYPQLSAVFCTYRSATPDFVKKEGTGISNYSQLEHCVKKYLGENVKIDYDITHHTL